MLRHEWPIDSVRGGEPLARRPRGSIYDGRSPAGQWALARLRAAFRRAGFYAEKERHTEHSLRVYPERRGRYPLLNPRIATLRTPATLAVREPSVVCPVYSDHDESITRMLRGTPAIASCRYLEAQPRRRATLYQLHGHFVLPLAVVADTRAQDVHFDVLDAPLAALHLHLTAALFHGA